MAAPTITPTQVALTFTDVDGTSYVFTGYITGAWTQTPTDDTPITGVNKVALTIDGNRIGWVDAATTITPPAATPVESAPPVDTPVPTEPTPDTATPDTTTPDTAPATPDTAPAEADSASSESTEPTTATPDATPAGAANTVDGA